MNNDLLQSLKAINGITYKLQQVTSASLSIISSTSGIFHGIFVGGLSNPTLTIYDNASGASGTVLGLIEPATKGTSYVIDTPIANGLTVFCQPGNAINAFISYR